MKKPKLPKTLYIPVDYATETATALAERRVMSTVPYGVYQLVEIHDEKGGK